MSQEVYIEASVEGLKGKMSDQTEYKVFQYDLWCHFSRYHRDFLKILIFIFIIRYHLTYKWRVIKNWASF